MNLIFRLIWTVLTSCLRQKISFTGETSKSFRVLPTDIDVFGRMNNGRFHQIIDVSRADWLARCGLGQMLIREPWSGAVAGSVIEFRGSLKMWQRYRVSTRVVSWDDRWFYFLHCFQTTSGKAVAAAGTKLCVTQEHETVPSKRITSELAPGVLPTDAPDWIQQWIGAEVNLHAAADFNIVLAQMGLDQGSFVDGFTGTSEAEPQTRTAMARNAMAQAA